MVRVVVLARAKVFVCVMMFDGISMINSNKAPSCRFSGESVSGMWK